MHMRHLSAALLRNLSRLIVPMSTCAYQNYARRSRCRHKVGEEIRRDRCGLEVQFARDYLLALLSEMSWTE